MSQSMMIFVWCILAAYFFGTAAAENYINGLIEELEQLDSWLDGANCAQNLVDISFVSTQQWNFAFELLRFGAQNYENAIFSPYSLSILLAMAADGARNNTQSEILDVIGEGAVRENIRHQFRSFQEQLNETYFAFEFHSASKLYVREGSEILEGYVEKIKNDYQADIELIDFSEPNSAAKIINDYVNNATDAKITNIVNQNSLNTDSRIMLVNAVYFKAKWRSPFDPEFTALKKFHVSPEQESEVQMMHTVGTFLYMENDVVQMIGFAYKGLNDLFMYVVLPRKKFSLMELELSTNGSDYLQWISNTTREQVTVCFPRFHIGQEMDVLNTVQKMDIKTAFSSNADFSGISTSPLFISAITHKAHINVNEHGTEAVAASATIMQELLAKPDGDTSKFMADHPFLYMIVHEKTILFLGHTFNINE